jgi:hypothetical protein
MDGRVDGVGGEVVVAKCVGVESDSVLGNGFVVGAADK